MTLDIEQILNFLHQPEIEGYVGCNDEAIFVGKIKSSDLKNIKNRLLEYRGDQIAYSGEWIRTKKGDAKIILSRSRTDRFWRVRFTEITTEEIFIAFNQEHMKRMRKTIRSLMKEASNFLSEGDVLELPIPTKSAHQKIQWMERLPHLNEFEHRLENTGCKPKNNCIFRVHQKNDILTLIAHGFHPDEGEEEEPTVVWTGRKP